MVHKQNIISRKWITIGIIAIFVVIVGGNIAVMQNKKNANMKDLKFTKVVVKEITNTKLISGIVTPSNEQIVYVDQAKGELKEVFVKEGQEIKKGQKLFSYDNSELTIQIKQFELDKKITNLRYEQGKQKITSLKREVQKAKDNGTPVDILNDQLQELEFQQKTIELEIEKMKLQAKELKNKQGDLIVYSKIAGIVEKVYVDAGQGSNQLAGVQGQPIIRISAKESFQIQGTLTELQKAQIKSNQPITVTAKAVSGKKWKGKIIEVSRYPISDQMGQSDVSGAGQTQNISYYNFKATLDSQEELAPGYHVAIQVDLSSKKMISVPRTSIVEKEDSSLVYVVNGNKLREQKVTTGIGDGQFIEVSEGLKIGDRVVENPSDKVYDGLEVKVND